MRFLPGFPRVRIASMTNKKWNGFIELLIVVAIILIIAAIAIPNLIRAKIAANQASAADSLITLDSTATRRHLNHSLASNSVGAGKSALFDSF
jgi:type II secretory pathway pseudopilin PulG